MKKISVRIISVLLSVLLLGGLLFTPAFAAVNGDVTQNNAVAADDARFILRAAVGLEKLTETQKQLADLDFDGSVTAADARWALRIAVGMEQVSKTAVYNEYDALRSGVYTAKLTSALGSTAEDAESLTFTFFSKNGINSALIQTVDSSLLSGMVSGDGAFGIYFDRGGKVLVTNEAKRVTYGFSDDGGKFSAMTDEELLVYMENELGAGEDISEENIFSLLGELDGFFYVYLSRLQPGELKSLPALSEANSVTNGSFNGTSCKVYSFKQGSDTLKVFINGKKLLSVQKLSSENDVIFSYSFSGICPFVTVKNLEPSTQAKTVDDFFSFLLISIMELSDKEIDDILSEL